MYSLIKNKLSLLFPQGYGFLSHNKVVVKYIISGGTAASVDLSLLFLLTHFLKFHYILSSSLAFSTAALISFSLQKFWTFRDGSKDVQGQFFVYVVVGLLNLGINAGFMYVLVEGLSVFYLFAQVLSGAVVAVWSFLVYRVFIFKRRVVAYEQK